MANIGVAIAKVTAAVLTASTAMTAEALDTTSLVQSVLQPRSEAQVQSRDFLCRVDIVPTGRT